MSNEVDESAANLTMGTTERKPIRLTKQDAAVRQIEAAIDAYRVGSFDVCITLAGAAEGIFAHRKGSDLHTAYMTDPRGVEFGRKEINALVNRERDWLKHTNDEQDIEMEIAETDAAVMLVRAMTKLERWTPKMNAIKPILYSLITGEKM